MKGSVRRADPKQQNGNFLVNRLEMDLVHLKRSPGGDLGHPLMWAFFLAFLLGLVGERLQFPHHLASRVMGQAKPVLCAPLVSENQEDAVTVT